MIFLDAFELNFLMAFYKVLRLYLENIWNNPSMNAKIKPELLNYSDISRRFFCKKDKGSQYL